MTQSIILYLLLNIFIDGQYKFNTFNCLYPFIIGENICSDKSVVGSICIQNHVTDTFVHSIVCQNQLFQMKNAINLEIFGQTVSELTPMSVF